ncbi:hypothetical protein BC332_21029, partial [Capsicum chinense]
DRIPMVNLADAFEKEGISAFRFDFAGNGESEGSFQYGNYRREADDLRAIVEHFHEEERFIATIVGHSKGGNVVLLYASSYKDVDAVVNISGRFNLERGIEGRLGRDFKEKIKHDGFIDVRNRRGNRGISLISENCEIHPHRDAPQSRSKKLATGLAPRRSEIADQHWKVTTVISFFTATRHNCRPTLDFAKWDFKLLRDAPSRYSTRISTIFSVGATR